MGAIFGVGLPHWTTSASTSAVSLQGSSPGSSVRGKAIDCMGDDYLVDDRNLPLTLPLFKDLEGDKYGVE